MQIRKATLHNIDTLIALRHDFLMDIHPDYAAEEMEASKPVLASYFKRHLNVDFWGYFAETDGDIVSTLHLLIHEHPASHRLPTGKLGVILSVYTKPQYRKRGFAAALLKEAMEEARRQGASLIELQASDMGKHVYRKLGFVEDTSDDTPMVYFIRSQSDDTVSIS